MHIFQDTKRHPKVQIQIQQNLMKDTKSNYREMFNNLSNTPKRNVNDKVMIVDGLNLSSDVLTVPTLNDDGEHFNSVCYPRLLSVRTNQREFWWCLMVKGFTSQKEMYSGYKEGRTGLTSKQIGWLRRFGRPTESMKKNFNLLIKYLGFLPVDLCYIDH